MFKPGTYTQEQLLSRKQLEAVFGSLNCTNDIQGWGNPQLSGIGLVSNCNYGYSLVHCYCEALQEKVHERSERACFAWTSVTTDPCTLYTMTTGLP